MFVCAFDGKSVGPGVKPIKVLLKTRKRSYIVESSNEDGDKEYRNTEGWEVVKEVDSCEACAQDHKRS